MQDLEYRFRKRLWEQNKKKIGHMPLLKTRNVSRPLDEQLRIQLLNSLFDQVLLGFRGTHG